MPKPQLDSAEFTKLKGFGTDSEGTVTGKHIDPGDDVNIRSKDSTKKWEGEVTEKISETKWKAVVQRVNGTAKAKKSGGKEDDKGIEKVAVTVTNLDGESNEVETDSEVP
jgi:hypothetical protein